SGFDSPFHQVEQRRPAGDVPHLRALLRCLRLRRRRDRRRRIWRPYELKGFHCPSRWQLRVLANVLDGGDDLLVRAAAAYVAAHQFLDIAVRGPPRLLELCAGRHDPTRRAATTWLSIMTEGCRPRGMRRVRRGERSDR